MKKYIVALFFFEFTFIYAMEKYTNTNNQVSNQIKSSFSYSTDDGLEPLDIGALLFQHYIDSSNKKDFKKTTQYQELFNLARYYISLSIMQNNSSNFVSKQLLASILEKEASTSGTKQAFNLRNPVGMLFPSYKSNVPISLQDESFLREYSIETHLNNSDYQRSKSKFENTYKENLKKSKKHCYAPLAFPHNKLYVDSNMIDNLKTAQEKTYQEIIVTAEHGSSKAKKILNILASTNYQGGELEKKETVTELVQSHSFAERLHYASQNSTTQREVMQLIEKACAQENQTFETIFSKNISIVNSYLADYPSECPNVHTLLINHVFKQEQEEILRYIQSKSFSKSIELATKNTQLRNLLLVYIEKICSETHKQPSALFGKNTHTSSLLLDTYDGKCPELHQHILDNALEYDTEKIKHHVQSDSFAQSLLLAKKNTALQTLATTFIEKIGNTTQEKLDTFFGKNKEAVCLFISTYTGKSIPIILFSIRSLLEKSQEPKIYDEGAYTLIKLLANSQELNNKKNISKQIHTLIKQLAQKNSLSAQIYCSAQNENLKQHELAQYFRNLEVVLLQLNTEFFEHYSACKPYLVKCINIIKKHTKAVKEAAYLYAYISKEGITGIHKKVNENEYQIMLNHAAELGDIRALHKQVHKEPEQELSKYLKILDKKAATKEEEIIFIEAQNKINNYYKQISLENNSNEYLKNFNTIVTHYNERNDIANILSYCQHFIDPIFSTESLSNRALYVSFVEKNILPIITQHLKNKNLSKKNKNILNTLYAKMIILSSLHIDNKAATVKKLEILTHYLAQYNENNSLNNIIGVAYTVLHKQYLYQNQNDKAFIILEKGIKLGSLDCMCEKGLLMLNRGTNLVVYLEAKKLLEIAAKAGHTKAQNFYGRLKLYGPPLLYAFEVLTTPDYINGYRAIETASLSCPVSKNLLQELTKPDMIKEPLELKRVLQEEPKTLTEYYKHGIVAFNHEVFDIADYCFEKCNQNDPVILWYRGYCALRKDLEKKENFNFDATSTFFVKFLDHAHEITENKYYYTELALRTLMHKNFAHYPQATAAVIRYLLSHEAYYQEEGWRCCIEILTTRIIKYLLNKNQSLMAITSLKELYKPLQSLATKYTSQIIINRLAEINIASLETNNYFLTSPEEHTTDLQMYLNLCNQGKQKDKLLNKTISLYISQAQKALEQKEYEKVEKFLFDIIKINHKQSEQDLIQIGYLYEHIYLYNNSLKMLDLALSCYDLAFTKFHSQQGLSRSIKLNELKKNNLNKKINTTIFINSEQTSTTTEHQVIKELELAWEKNKNHVLGQHLLQIYANPLHESHNPQRAQEIEKELSITKEGILALYQFYKYEKNMKNEKKAFSYLIKLGELQHGPALALLAGYCIHDDNINLDMATNYITQALNVCTDKITFNNLDDELIITAACKIYTFLMLLAHDTNNPLCSKAAGYLHHIQNMLPLCNIDGRFIFDENKKETSFYAKKLN